MGLERLDEIDDLLLFDAALVGSEQAVGTHQPRNDRHMVPVEVELEAAQKEVRSIDVKIDRLFNLLAETTVTATLLRKIESLEQERTAIIGRLEIADTATKQAKTLREIGEKEVRDILNGIFDSISELDRDDLKEILNSLIDRIVFDFLKLECCIYYKIPVKSRKSKAGN